MKILIVDDSLVYRSQIKGCLAGVPWIEIVGTAANGRAALEIIRDKSVDLVTLDMEMPEMDGIQTLKHLRAKGGGPKVIMFSSATRKGSEATLEALTHGANDFVAKPILDGSKSESVDELIRRELVPKIEQFRLRTPALRKVEKSEYLKKQISTFLPSIIVIASSTGGPAAHDEIFKGLHGQLTCPILIAQHMPPIFTTSFAKRIATSSGLPCREAVDGEEISNNIYVAPGDFHLSIEEKDGRKILRLDQGPQINSVRPAADRLFETAAKIFRSKCMGFVLTGMGEDGYQGARSIKAHDGGVMIQDQASCVVFGMPGSIFASQIQDAVGNLSEIRLQIQRMALK